MSYLCREPASEGSSTQSRKLQLISANVWAACSAFSTLASVEDADKFLRAVVLLLGCSLYCLWLLKDCLKLCAKDHRSFLQGNEAAFQRSSFTWTGQPQEIRTTKKVTFCSKFKVCSTEVPFYKHIAMFCIMFEDN